MSVTWTRDGHVARVTLDRPEARNALDPATIEQLAAHLDAIEADANLRVVLLAGAGDRVWCAGADLGTLANDPVGRANAVRAYAQLITRLDRCRRPIVAVARGHVLAGGMGLWCAADLAVCGPGVTFSLPEAGVGLWPMMVGALLYRHLPWRIAQELALTGRKMTAEEAAGWGLVNRVAADPDAAAEAMCQAIAARSPHAIRRGRAAWRDWVGQPPADALPALAEELIATMEHPDAFEGVVAFFQKRTPTWKVDT